ncbi:MAG: methyl-accepting chemotaxis protein [Deltaproteobacteria bacterium]|nr:methyl-accepting chemotaxis protein [Deltaproteobacteria bacterium]
MKLNFRGLSNKQKLFLSLSVLFAIAFLDYRSFTSRHRQVELYDDLNARISSIRVSITQLEYLLDMFTVARRFENSSVELIRHDVERLDESIGLVVNNPGFKEAVASNAQLEEALGTISEDWQTIKAEITRLNDALSQDEIILVHNAVDVNAVLVIEKTERLMGRIAAERARIFDETKSLARTSIIGFVLFILAASFLAYRRYIRPLERAALTARRLSDGDSSASFREDRSSLGHLSIELNRMVASFKEASERKDRRRGDIEAELKTAWIALEAVGSILKFAGRSLSLPDVFKAAARESASAFGTGAVAVYAMEEGAFRLKASEGFDDNFMREWASADQSAFDTLDKGAAVFKALDRVRPAGLAERLKESGFAGIVIAPIEYDSKPMGVLVAALKEASGGAVAFYGSIAAALGVSAGHVGLLQAEMVQRKFLERVVNQVPFGVAVFGRDGSCVMMNSVLKKLLGADPRPGVHRHYSVFEDDILSAQGMLTSIKKAYEGYSTEFIINYNPSLLSRCGFMGAAKRLKIRSIPLYDSGGEISNIALLYEDMTDQAGITAGGAGSGDIA